MSNFSFLRYARNYLFHEDSLYYIINSIILYPDHLITELQEISQDNLPQPVRLPNLFQQLEIFEYVASQTQQIYTVFHLYPIPTQYNRTGLHQLLSVTQKYNARINDSLMQIPINKNCATNYTRIQLLPLRCEAQFLRNFRTVPENYKVQCWLAKDTLSTKRAKSRGS